MKVSVKPLPHKTTQNKTKTGGGSGRKKRNRKLWKTVLKYCGKNAEVWLFIADGLWQGEGFGKGLNYL